MNSEGMLAQAMSSKESGNQFFKNLRYVEAIQCYTRALDECPQDHQCRAVFLKNRAACYLKLQQFSSALSDCTQALSIDPSDVKALYRRAVAYESSGNLTDAFTDIKHLLSIEPRNKEATELARKLTTIIKKQHEMLQSTDGVIKEMFQALRDHNLPQSKRIMAAKNCAILSQERPGADKLYQAGAMDILLPLLDLGSPEVSHHVLQTFAGLCIGQKARAYAIIQKISLEKISSLISDDASEVSCSAITVVKQALLSVSADTAVIVPIVQMLFTLLLDGSVTSTARDHIMEMLISTIPKVIIIGDNERAFIIILYSGVFM